MLNNNFSVVLQYLLLFTYYYHLLIKKSIFSNSINYENNKKDGINKVVYNYRK